MALTDYPLTPCDFKKWARYESLPIEQGCFVLLGYEPPSIQVLRYRPVQYQERPGKSWEKPPGFDDMLALLENSIKADKVAFRQDDEHRYMTKHVAWPVLVDWAASKGYAVPPELLSVPTVAQPVVAPAESLDLPVAHEELTQPAPTVETNTGWSMHKPNRYQGYGKPLYDLLRAELVAGKPCPNAREVLDTWKSSPPAEVSEVTNEGLKYYDANGDTKPADLNAIRQAINRLVK
jgi:hypothetical protein